MSKAKARASHMPRERTTAATPEAPASAPTPRKLGTRNTRILAIDVSQHRQQDAADAILTSQAASAPACASNPAACSGHAERREDSRRSSTDRAAASATAASSIIARWRPEYSSTIASCTMVSSRWVAGLSTGMRPFSASATMTRAISAMAERHAQPDRPVQHEFGDSGELRRAGDQRDREHHHDHRRFGQRGDHHLAR